MREEMRKFAEFDLMTKNDRIDHFGFSTQKEFAKEFKVTEKTLCEWRHKATFERHKKKLIKQNAGNGLSDVINTLKLRANEGDVAAIKLYLEYMGELIKKQEISISDDDLDVFMDNLEEILKNRLKHHPLILQQIQEDIANIDDEE